MASRINRTKSAEDIINQINRIARKTMEAHERNEQSVITVAPNLESLQKNHRDYENRQSQLDERFRRAYEISERYKQNALNSRAAKAATKKAEEKGAPFPGFVGYRTQVSQRTYMGLNGG